MTRGLNHHHHDPNEKIRGVAERKRRGRRERKENGISRDRDGEGEKVNVYRMRIIKQKSLSFFYLFDERKTLF